MYTVENGLPVPILASNIYHKVRPFRKVSVRPRYLQTDMYANFQVRLLKRYLWNFLERNSFPSRRKRSCQATFRNSFHNRSLILDFLIPCTLEVMYLFLY